MAKFVGKAGYRFFEEKANSMVFYINTFKHYAARTLADVGVVTFSEMRQFLTEYGFSFSATLFLFFLFLFFFWLSFPAVYIWVE